MASKTSYVHPLPLLVACVAFGALLAVPGGKLAAQEPVHESAVCLDCHDGQDATLAETAHALRGDADATGVPIACTDCHGSNSKHWEEGPEENPMIHPSRLGAAAEANLCASCHQTSHQQNMRERNVHTANGINCSGCHSIHASNKHTTLLKQEEPGLCYSCHPGVEGEFARSYRHPVSDGVMKCSECHMKLGETRRELSLNGTNVCTSCHAEFQGPFPFEHQATLDFSTEEGGCLNCHAAHGSDNPRMLNQPYEPPHFQLCSQCHSVPPGHNLNPNHGTQWAGLACNTCHTDVHGSYDNRFFLRESLRAEGCLKAGCHGH
jgi:DmsE family decaheme c-type cytochrome